MIFIFKSHVFDVNSMNNESLEEYKYRKVMHGKTEGDRNNEKVYPNPNPTDLKPMYIAKRVRHDEITKFENIPLTWKYRKKNK